MMPEEPGGGRRQRKAGGGGGAFRPAQAQAASGDWNVQDRSLQDHPHSCQGQQCSKDVVSTPRHILSLPAFAHAVFSRGQWLQTHFPSALPASCVGSAVGQPAGRERGEDQLVPLELSQRPLGARPCPAQVAPPWHFQDQWHPSPNGRAGAQAPWPRAAPAAGIAWPACPSKPPASAAPAPGWPVPGTNVPLSERPHRLLFLQGPQHRPRPRGQGQSEPGPCCHARTLPPHLPAKARVSGPSRTAPPPPPPKVHVPTCMATLCSVVAPGPDLYTCDCYEPLCDGEGIS